MFRLLRNHGGYSPRLHNSCNAEGRGWRARLQQDHHRYEGCMGQHCSHIASLSTLNQSQGTIAQHVMYTERPNQNQFVHVGCTGCKLVVICRGIDRNLKTLVLTSSKLIVSRYVAESITTDAVRFGHVGLCQLHTKHS